MLCPWAFLNLYWIMDYNHRPYKVGLTKKLANLRVKMKLRLKGSAVVEAGEEPNVDIWGCSWQCRMKRIIALYSHYLWLTRKLLRWPLSKWEPLVICTWSSQLWPERFCYEIRDATYKTWRIPSLAASCLWRVFWISSGLRINPNTQQASFYQAQHSG